MRSPHLLSLVAAYVIFAACSVLLPPTVTPTPTPKPSFGIVELREAFSYLPEHYVEVDPKSRELGSANFNDAFDLQLAFLDSDGQSRGFSVSLGILSPSDQEAFDYTLEEYWGTADVDLIQTDNLERAIGLFWLDIGDIALGSRFLEMPVQRAQDLREAITFRRGEVAVSVRFAQQVNSMRNPLASGIPTGSRALSLMERNLYCGDAYICYDKQPGLIIALDAASMIDEAIVRFYGDTPASGDG